MKYLFNFRTTMFIIILVVLFSQAVFAATSGKKSQGKVISMKVLPLVVPEKNTNKNKSPDKSNTQPVYGFKDKLLIELTFAGISG